MPAMTIYCQNLDEFIKVCAGLVREGVRFRAYPVSLEITLTGGF